MQLWEIVLIGIGLAMDAFAVSICKGLATGTTDIKKAGIAGLWFGGFQALMPLVGYFLGRSVLPLIEKIDHWVAFIVLAVIGANMIREAFSDDENTSRLGSDFSPSKMLPLAVATSIDALAVGISFAALAAPIFFAAALIGIITFVIASVGVAVGAFFGLRWKKNAQIIGGVILVLIGIKILLEHLFFQ